MHFILRSPARIHMSLLDLNGSLGRIDGGLGFGLEDPHFEIEFSNNDSKPPSFQGDSDNHELFKSVYSLLQKRFHFPENHISIKILKTMPLHIGFGSKTQLLLSFAMGICKIFQKEVSLGELTDLINRGGTSGIGYQVFEKGGFYVDLGHSFGPNGDKITMTPSSNSKAPPALPFYHIDFPEQWKLFLIIPDVLPGASNKEEVDIFDHYTPINQDSVEKISHRLLFQLIPSLLTRNLSTLADSVHFINNQGFKQVEISLQHPIIPYLINNIYESENLPVGMSSFGPLIYVIVDKSYNFLDFQQKVEDLLQNFPNPPKLTFMKTNPNNSGYLIDHLP
ncbi:MAG: beta-ribofuranosylaminobenzene 5'-phosphate synthase family protein [Promethearchaeota archaeon]